MKIVKKQPITGTNTAMRPRANILSNQTNTSAQGEQLVRRPPMPFQTKQGPAMMPTGSGSAALKGVGNGKSKNTAGFAKGPIPSIAASGDKIPGGYGKVVGGQKGQSHPSKKGDVTMGTKSHKNAKFFGR